MPANQSDINNAAIIIVKHKLKIYGQQLLKY